MMGADLFRDLALQDVDVLLVDEGDFCSGTLACSRIIPSGIHFLEKRKIRLAREAALERDRLIETAPHLVRPLPVVLPIYKLFSGHGALAAKVGLMLYDSLTKGQGIVPEYKFDNRQKSLAKYPKLNGGIKYTATFYAGQILSPERLTIELILDGENEGAHAKALNYVSFERGQGNRVTLRDKLTGNTLEILPKYIVDFTQIDEKKDLYLVLNHSDLRETISKDGFIVENENGSNLLIFPFYDKVILKVHPAPEETQEIIKLVSSIFPTIKITSEQVIFRFSSADSSDAVAAKVTGSRGSEVIFSAQVADKLMSALGKVRKVDIRKIQIGGGKDYPLVGIAKIEFVKKVADELADSATVGKTVQFQPKKLFERYGTRALEVAKYIKTAKDEPLKSNPDRSRREFEFLVECEKAVHVDDILLRRSMLAWLGEVDKPLIEELTEIMSQSLGWTTEQEKAEAQRTLDLMRDLHGVSL